MMDLVIAIAVLAIIILGWGYMKRAMDWTGARVGDTTDLVSDLTKSASVQTGRGLAISRSSFKDTMLESIQNDAKRQEKKAKFLSGLNEAQLKTIKKEEDYLQAILNR